MAKPKTERSFQTTGWIDWLGGTVGRYNRLVGRLADIETRFVEDWLDAHPVTSPIFISGMACTGTTILLETLNQHPEVGSHQHRDFPLVQIPYWWNSLLDRIEKKPTAAAERAHGNGIPGALGGPEAMEEVVWTQWFDTLHDPQACNVLDGAADYSEFERFYRNHIGKLLMVRDAKRYLSMGSYNLTRLAYLLKIFPDARFLIPVRSPFTQIPSLMRRHRRVSDELADNPKGRAHLSRIGQFEFGPDRRPINIGDDALTASIEQLWTKGDEVRGWARYWAAINGFVADQLITNPKLGAACMVIRYEDFCSAHRELLCDAFSHARLDATDALIDEHVLQLEAPEYYDQSLTEQEIRTIREEAGPAAARFGCYL